VSVIQVSCVGVLENMTQRDQSQGAGGQLYSGERQIRPVRSATHVLELQPREPMVRARPQARCDEADEEWVEVAKRRAEEISEAAFFAESEGHVVGMIAVIIDEDGHSPNLNSMNRHRRYDIDACFPQ
jgi:hypothetical protein